MAWMKQARNRRLRVAEVAVAGMHLDHARVAAALARVARWPAQRFGPVRGQALHVLRVLTGVRERMVEFGILQAALVVSRREAEERFLASGELVQRRPHGGKPGTGPAP